MRKEVVEPDATASERESVWRETTYTRNPQGLVTSVVSRDATGLQRRMDLRYDSLERMFLVSRILYPSGQPGGLELRTDYAWHRGLGVVALEEDPNGLRTRSFYDSLGRWRGEDGPDAADSILSYGEEEGRPLLSYRGVDFSTCTSRNGLWDLSTCTRNGQEAQVRLDGLGRELLSRTRGFDGSWTLVSHEYDTRGRRIATSLPYTEGSTAAWHSLQYDSLDRPRFLRNPDGTQREVRYEGLRTLFWDEKRNHRYVVADELGRLVRSAEVTPQGTTGLHRP